MANGDTPQVSLMDREGGLLSDEDVEAVEVEALPNEMSRITDIEGIEIIQEEDGGASVDFDPMRSRTEKMTFTTI